MKRDKEKERGRNRRAYTKELMVKLGVCLDQVPIQLSKRSDRRGKLGSGRTAPALLAEVRDVLRRMKARPGSQSPRSPTPGSPGPGAKKSGVADDILARGLLESRALLVFRTSLPDGKIILWNKALQERWLSSSLSQNMTLLMLVHPDDADRATRIVSGCAKCGHGQTIAVNEFVKLMRREQDFSGVFTFRWSYVQLQTVTITQNLEGLSEAVFVASDSLILNPPALLNGHGADHEQAAIWNSLSGIYQYDAQKSRSSPMDVLFELRNRIHYDSSLAEHFHGLAAAMHQVVSNWYQSACRSVGNQLLGSLKFHLNMEPRPGQSPWMTVHASILVHSQWKLVLSGPLDGSLIRGRKRADNSEGNITLSMADGLPASKCGIVCHEYRGIPGGSRLSRESSISRDGSMSAKLEDNDSGTESGLEEYLPQVADVAVQRSIAFMDDGFGDPKPQTLGSLLCIRMA
mmetsp:Transcript_42530/g.66632  ORF Transcript_42530/g.66632 Transcript_42530/m.66632 type:complete len:460 (+) Transcript_42530:75-1454(+)